MQQNMQQVARAQLQASTGQRYSSFADDPQAQSSVMQSSGAIRAIEQYRKNVSDATARTALEDSVLDQISTTLDRARQVAIEQSSSTATAATRAGAKAEIDNLIEFIAGLGNTKYADSYLFGGDDVTSAPISNVSPFYTTSQPPSGNHKAEISAGRLFRATHNARELLLDTNVMQSLTDLSAALAGSDRTQISAAIDPIITAHGYTQALVGDLGARINQLDITAASLESMRINLTMLQSDVSEIGQEEAYTELLARQNTFQAAMLATSRVMGMTLTDYLR